MKRVVIEMSFLPKIQSVNLSDFGNVAIVCHLLLLGDHLNLLLVPSGENVRISLRHYLLLGLLDLNLLQLLLDLLLLLRNILGLLFAKVSSAKVSTRHHRHLLLNLLLNLLLWL